MGHVAGKALRLARIAGATRTRVRATRTGDIRGTSRDIPATKILPPRRQPGARLPLGPCQFAPLSDILGRMVAAS